MPPIKDGNILVLCHDGHYLAEIGNGLRVVAPDGRRADFASGSETEIELQRSYTLDSMEDLHVKVVNAMLKAREE